MTQFEAETQAYYTVPPERPRFVDALLSGIDVSKRLGTRCTGFPRPIEQLVELAEDGLSDGRTSRFRINFHPRNYESRAFIGTIEAFPDHAHVYYDRNQRFCWRRFIAAKEISHLLFAPEGEVHLVNTPEGVGQLIANLLAGIERIDLSSDHAGSTEICTMLMALEILLPHKERRGFQLGWQNLDIANHYKVPENLVNLYMSQGYIANMNASFTLLGE